MKTAGTLKRRDDLLGLISLRHPSIGAVVRYVALGVIHVEHAFVAHKFQNVQS